MPPEPIFAVSCQQPWAQLIALGAKTIECRDFAPAYRGRLAIHASLAFGYELGSLCVREPFRSVLSAAGYHLPGQLPRGALLATCELWDVVPTESIVGTLTPQERAFGDYTPLRWAWLLRDVVRLPYPIRTNGRRALWDVTGLLSEAAL